MTNLPDQTAPLTRWAQRLQAMAQTGLTYASDRYDQARYEELRRIAAEMMAAQLDANAAALERLYALEDGYATPKVDVRAVAFRGDGILLVRERSDGLWTLPGGWADVGDTPSHAAEREMWEESGFTAKAVKLLAFYDRDTQGHPPIPYSAYKAYFLCEITGGEAAVSDETDGVDFFLRDALPPLSVERVTERQILRFFEHAHHPQWPTEFD
jgi:ADP-ribose pyrophosphatase YjhB (NUDIX family)